MTETEGRSMTGFNDVLTIAGAATECGHSPETVRRWIKTGRLPAHKLGNQFVVRRADLVRACPKLRAQQKAEALASLERIRALREEIYQHAGHIDVLEMLDRSRESHP